MGTVVNVESYYDQNDEIYTFVTLEELDILDGSYDQDTLVLRLKGGQVNGEIIDVYGSPQFSPDDEVILFLRGNGKAMVPIVGWTQGVFRVVSDEETGREVVSDHEGNRIFGIKGSKIIKEYLYPTKANIFDTKTGTLIPGQQRPVIPDEEIMVPQTFSSAMQDDASPGITDDGSSSKSKPLQRQPLTFDHEIISVQEFIDTIAQKLTKKSPQNIRIISVNVETFLRSGNDLESEPKDARRNLKKPGSTFPKLELDEPVLPKPYEKDTLQEEEEK